MKKKKLVNVLSWDHTTRINGFEGPVASVITNDRELIQWEDGSFSFTYSDKPQFELSNPEIITIQNL